MKLFPSVFIASDFILDPVLDAVAETLRTRGYQIVRGAPAVPGKKTSFALPPEWVGSVERLDVIVLTSRVTLDFTALNDATRLRGIVFPSIGIETVDLAEASRRGLLVANGATPENFESIGLLPVPLTPT